MRTKLIVLLLVGCARRAAVVVDAAPEASAPPAPPAPEAAPPASPPRELTGAPDRALVDSDAGTLGVVAVPIGARAPRPIMIALHGGSDHPEWACSAWRGISASYAFVVCPRGVGEESALAWSSAADTKARIERAVAATEAAYGDWVQPTKTTVLVGFSMGATQTALLAQLDPARYRRVSLAESAYAPEPALAFAKPWAKGGGERALFLCTTDGCETTYRRVARNVAAEHVPARLNIARVHAHGMWDPVVRSMRRDWPWLVEGAEGWEGYVPPEEAALPGQSEFF